MRDGFAVRLSPGLAALLILVLVAPARPATAQGKAWTILVYMDADNDLEEWGIADFLEMSSVGSTAQVNVVVQMDRSPGPPTTYGDWTTTRRFYITPGMTPATGEIADLGEVNMADPANLSAFVNWGIAGYPADHYFLVLWDHGLGWQGVVIDDTPVMNDRLTPPELRSALSAIVAANGRRIDLLGNDACRMTLEIDYELADFVDYFVGSEKDEPLEGWPYDTFLQAVTADPTMSPGSLASVLADRYVESYRSVSPYSVALSAVDASALRALVTELNGVLDELAVEQPYFTAEVVAARAATEHYEIGGGPGGLDYDLFHFIENVVNGTQSWRVARKAAGFFDAFEAAVLHEAHWDNPTPINQVHAEHAHGLSLYFPTVGGGGPEYAQLAFGMDSGWDEFLLSYANGSRTDVAANASAAVMDPDGDGLDDELVLRWDPAANGTMALDVYLDGRYEFSRAYGVTENRSDEVRIPGLLGGDYALSFYLFAGNTLVNLTRVGGLVLEERVVFRGQITGSDGQPLAGASVTLVHVATGDRATATTDAGGNYTIAVTYPTFFRNGDAMALEVVAGDRRAVVTFTAALGADRSVVQDVRLDTVGLWPWYAAVGTLAVIAALAFVGVLYYRNRLKVLRRIP